MRVEVRCPRCGQVVEGHERCRHLRWTPDRGGPVQFARHVVESSPYTERRGFSAGRIPAVWWESHEEWLLQQILLRLDVLDGYCFGDPAEIDRVCLDIWHRFAPEESRAAPLWEVPR